MAIVYKITNLVNNKFYIGYTSKTLEERWYTHINDLQKGYCPKLYNAILKYGIEQFYIEELFVGSDDQAKSKEKELIESMAPDYNIAAGGSGGDTGRNADLNKRAIHSKFMKKYRAQESNLQKTDRIRKMMMTKQERGSGVNPVVGNGLEHPKWSGYWVVNGVKYTTSREAAKLTNLNESTIIDLCVHNVDVVRKRSSKLIPKGKTPREMGYFKGDN